MTSDSTTDAVTVEPPPGIEVEIALRHEIFDPQILLNLNFPGLERRPRTAPVRSTKCPPD
jgi:hypothetical protein